ncbi:Arc family DNA-binding protein [Pseudochrobactrum sp. sp1633]|uniref:Arc family DNA-binding protein n=1 Tax=Pseudochrobactrum sp. sp1633 TaxID=3036706 RepID=UPI0025A675D3|nr:Arc family DNA-binding protein [Pseudochrobactrum sp. sp1633]MDM8346455.1 Arc family DNA-binding protein [Pseudochrobactrum sp. sp1633]
MAREDLHFRLRIPEDLKNKIEEAASANRRSMTAEIVNRLETSFNIQSELGQSLEDSKKHLAFSEYAFSQMKLMRYLLDQVAASDGNLDLDLLNIIRIISSTTSGAAGEFDLDKAILLIKEATQVNLD